MQADWDVALTSPGEPGHPLVIEGRLLGLPDSLPLRGATLRVYHADANGRYGAGGGRPARLTAVLHTNVAGGFRVRTIVPGLAEGVPHVHFVLSAPGIETRTGQLFLCRSHGAGSDSTFAHLPWMVRLPNRENYAYVERDASGDGYHCAWTWAVRRTPGQ